MQYKTDEQSCTMIKSHTVDMIKRCCHV